jgi:glycosyltransferase involved in cell wall biosynthesis
MTRPLISIVTPSFNQAAYLRECLHSVATQEAGLVEHLVVDGGSSDDTVSVLQSFDGKPEYAHLQWTSERDRGQSDALNKGFRAASGEIIGWLNSDDRYRAGCFRAALQAFRDHPEVDVIYGDYAWIDERGNVLQLRREISFSAFVLLYHRVLYIPTTAMFFRRRILEGGHLLDDSLHYAMDFEFFVRLHANGYRFLHIPVFLGDFRFQPGSKTSLHPERQLAEQKNVMRRYSPLLRHQQQGALSQGLTGVLRAAAAVRRYGEKALRGYYLTQFRGTALSK